MHDAPLQAHAGHSDPDAGGGGGVTLGPAGGAGGGGVGGPASGATGAPQIVPQTGSQRVLVVGAHEPSESHAPLHA